MNSEVILKRKCRLLPKNKNKPNCDIMFRYLIICANSPGQQNSRRPIYGHEYCWEIPRVGLAFDSNILSRKIVSIVPFKATDAVAFNKESNKIQ